MLKKLLIAAAFAVAAMPLFAGSTAEETGKRFVRACQEGQKITAEHQVQKDVLQSYDAKWFETLRSHEYFNQYQFKSCKEITKRKVNVIFMNFDNDDRLIVPVKKINDETWLVCDDAFFEAPPAGK